MARTEGDLLKYHRETAAREMERYRAISFQTYYSQLLSGELPPPARNAYDLTVQALTIDNPPVPDPAGYFVYPSFEKGEGDLALFGVRRPLDNLMRYLRASATADAKDRILLLVAPSGAGKSTAIRIITDRLERYTGEKDPAPAFAIKGCAYNEDPLHILDRRGREELAEERKIVVKGELCPDCERRKMDSFRDGKDPEFEVTALKFSSRMGQGITTLEPRLTRSEMADKQSIIEQVILGSNRGILHIAEFLGHDISFLESLKDLFRGRRLIHGSKTFDLDNIIIGDTTIEELDTLKKKPGIRPLIERIQLVFLTYPLSLSDDIRAYEKHFQAAGYGINLPHVSPVAWEAAAHFALPTRLVPFRRDDGQGGAKTLTVAEKIDLYNGQYVEGFRQGDRPEIEEAGLKEGEGLKGVSPQHMFGIIDRVLAAEASIASPGCIDATKIFRALEDNPQSDPGLLKEAKDWFNSRITAIVERAFLDNFPARANEALKKYLDECEFLLDPNEAQKKNPRKNPVTGDFMGANEGLLEEFENHVKPGIQETERYQFRFEKFQKAGGVGLREHREPVYTDFPEFETGLKEMLTDGTGDPKDILKLQEARRNEKQRQKIEEVEARLINEYGFCECCAPRMVDHVGNLLRAQDNKSTSRK